MVNDLDIWIQNIKDSKQYNKLVKKYLENKIKGSTVTISDGTNDGGQDFVLRNSQEITIKKIIQATVQKTAIESKITTDLNKANELINESGFETTVLYFCSQPISQSKTNQLESFAGDLGIFLDLYDSKRLAQELERYPDVVNFLLVDIHQVNTYINNEQEINNSQRVLYDYLLMSKESVEFKLAIFTAHVLSLISISPMTLSEIQAACSDFHVSDSTVSGRLQNLVKQKRIIFCEEKYSLTPEEVQRINNNKILESEQRSSIIKKLEIILSENNLQTLAEQVLENFQEVYQSSLDLQLTEMSFTPPKNNITKDIVLKIKSIIKTNSPQLNKDQIESIINQLIEELASNEYLANKCSADLCMSLILDNKLEKYIKNKIFYIYIDAPVLIPYLIAQKFSSDKNGVAIFDRSLMNVKHMSEIISNIQDKKIRVTLDHFEETVRHLEHAYKLSLFVTDNLLNELGNSKNVYFNIYLKWKSAENLPESSFNEFLYKFIRLDQDIQLNTRNAFSIFSQHLSNLTSVLNIQIISNFDVPSVYIENVKKKYRWISDSFKDRNTRSLENDIRCTYLLLNETEHLDSDGILSTPIFITLDGSQYQLRDAVRKIEPHSEWSIYTPQKTIERFSMLSLKINPRVLKEGLLASFYENYYFETNTSSLIDTLSIILGDKPTDSSDVIDFLLDLKNKISNDSLEPEEIDIEKYNILSDILIYTYYEFKDNFEKIRRLFNDANAKDEIQKLLIKTIELEKFTDFQKQQYSQKINSLLNQID